MVPRVDGAHGGAADGGGGSSMTRSDGHRAQSVDSGGAHGARDGGAGVGALPDDGIDGGSVQVVVLSAAPLPVGPAGEASAPPPVSGPVAAASSAPLVSSAHGVAMGPPVAQCTVGGSGAAAAAPAVVSAVARVPVCSEPFSFLNLGDQPSRYLIQIVEVKLAKLKPSMAKKTWPPGDAHTADVELFLALFRETGVNWSRGLVTVDAHNNVIDGFHRVAALLLLQEEGHDHAIDRLPVRRVKRRDRQPLTLVDTFVVQHGH